MSKLKSIPLELVANVFEGQLRCLQRQLGSVMVFQLGGDVSRITTQCQSRHKKGHKTTVYLSDVDGDAIAESVRGHEELYDKTHKKFKDKAQNNCPWERFSSSLNLSVKVCKTWFESQKTCYRKLTQSKNWINGFEEPHQKEGPHQVFWT